MTTILFYGTFKNRNTTKKRFSSVSACLFHGLGLAKLIKKKVKLHKVCIIYFEFEVPRMTLLFIFCRKLC